MINPSASTQRRPSAYTSCSMANRHYQFNQFSSRAPTLPPAFQQCLLGARQAPQLQIPTTASAVPQASQVNTAAANNGSVATNLASNQPQTLQPHQTLATFRQDQSNLTTSNLATHNLQHLFASHHPASNCVALAAALASASASFHQTAHQLQQQHLQQQQQHQSPINHHPQQQQQQITSAANTAPHQQNATNQVPILNFNSYNAAQPFLNLTNPGPMVAHLNSTSITTSTNVTITSSQTNTGNQSHQSHHQPPQRPLATNTTLNSVANQQQQQTNYGNALTTQLQPPIQQQQHNVPQQINQQNARNILLGDEAFSSLLSEHFNEHFQAIVLNQLLANPQFVPPVTASTAPAPQPQAPQINLTRHITPPPPANGSASILSGHQQVNSVAAQQQQTSIESSTAEPEQPSAFQPVSQAQAQTGMTQVPPTDNNSTAATSNAPAYMQQQHGPVNRQQQQQPPELLQTQPPLQQQNQPQSIPPLGYPYNQQFEQALALLANFSPQVTTSLFNQMFNIYLQNGLRSESHTHHHHHPPHHYHHHLHGSHHHHHHHHGPNGQNNGQDDTMLTISESKPRGLNRAEIDSLTPYIQMNEKDPRTCVICLSRFELKSKIRPLPCNHAFHAKCVDKWLRANRTCPICRRDALKTYGAKIKRI